MRRTVMLILAAIVAAPALGQSPAPQPAIRDPDLAERAYIAASAYHAVKRYFAHAEGLPADYDFEARYRAYLAEALAAPDRAAFTRASMRFFASLRNGHSSFTDRQLGERAGPAPFSVRRVDGRWTITESRLADLAPGDVIVTIDGQSPDAWLAPRRELVAASNEAAADRAQWFFPLMPQRFTIGTAGGRAVVVDLNTVPDVPPRGRRRPEKVETIRRPDGVLVIRIPSFDDRAFESAAIDAVKQAGAARAILFDVRGNGGGATPSRLLAAIMNRPYRGTLYVTPQTIAEVDAQQVFGDGVPALPKMMLRLGPDVTQPAPGAWAGKMAVLADGGCGSACEDFVLRFRDGKRGLVLGEATAGTTGQPYFVRFPEFGMSFRVSTKREYFPDGAPFEGVGVRPDRAIPLTLAELRDGGDVQLEQAVKAMLAS